MTGSAFARTTLVVIALVTLAHVAAALALRAPVADFIGARTIAIAYVWMATFVGVALVLSGRATLLRGLLTAYAAMGAAGLVTLLLASRVYFPDGIYVKAQRPLGASALTLAATNVIAGVTALRIGLRASLAEAIGGTLAAAFVAAPLALAAVVVVQAFEHAVRAFAPGVR